MQGAEVSGEVGLDVAEGAVEESEAGLEGREAVATVKAVAG